MSPTRGAVAGSTGSIGTQTLEVIAAAGDDYVVDTLMAGSSLEPLVEAIGRRRSIWRPMALIVQPVRVDAAIAEVLVIDPADADLADAVTETGMRCVVAPSVMSTPERAEALARACLAAVG